MTCEERLYNGTVCRRPAVITTPITDASGVPVEGIEGKPVCAKHAPAPTFVPHYRVYHLPDGQGVEVADRHPAADTTADDLLAEYREAGHRVIQVRYVDAPGDSGSVEYFDPTYHG